MPGTWLRLNVSRVTVPPPWGHETLDVLESVAADRVYFLGIVPHVTSHGQFHDATPRIVTSLRRETDALKLASVRAGLLELSQAWGSLGRKCALLAEAQTVSHTAIQGGASGICSTFALILSQRESNYTCTCT